MIHGAREGRSAGLTLYYYLLLGLVLYCYVVVFVLVVGLFVVCLLVFCVLCVVVDLSRFGLCCPFGWFGFGCWFVGFGGWRCWLLLVRCGVLWFGLVLLFLVLRRLWCLVCCCYGRSMCCNVLFL